jgi:uncharacterized cupredoxin-like copper-binding protein
MTPYFRITLAVLLVIACSMAAFVASAQATRTATITFTRPTKYVDGTDIAAATVITYGVYQGAKGSANKVKVGEITSTATTVTSGLQPGEVCFQISATANGVEGAKSNEACKTFAFPAPETVTITVQ